MNTVKCKKCGAEMVWAVNSDGKRVPLAAKSKEHRYVLMGETYQLRETYQTHFVDCPFRDEFRKKGEIQDKLL